MILISAVLVGCSSVQQSQKTNLRDSFSQLSADQKAQQKKTRMENEQEARDRKMVLTRQSQLGGPSYPQALPQTSAKLTPSLAQRGKVLEVNPDSVIARNYEKMPEGQLYAEIMDRYQAHDLWGFELRSKAYLGKFAKSDRRDEIIYLKGMMDLGERNYGGALAQFNRVLRDHPNGKKAPSAMFAKGMTYRKMNLAREAKLALREVLQRYPGSPESMRAKAELKIIK